MSREIKFRAWDNNLKRWLNENEYQEIRINPIQDRFGNGFNLNDSNFPYISDSFNCDIRFVQFTGLRDKNNKEIYEGDIVIYNTRANGYKPEYSKEPQTIVWNEKLARFEFKDFWYSAGLIYNNYEIIGNVYESKYLLNQ